jgi:hypothetical protein
MLLLLCFLAREELRAKDIYLRTYLTILNVDNTLGSLFDDALSRLDNIALRRCSFDLKSNTCADLIHICDYYLRLKRFLLV